MYYLREYQMKLYRVRGFNSPYIPRMAKVLLVLSENLLLAEQVF